MLKVVTAAEMREMDRVTIEEIGIPGAVLMEHAGRAVADEVLTMVRAGARVAVVCGSGNNGGDGFVAARWLRERGIDARVILVAGRPRAGGDAALHLAAYERCGGRVLEASDATSLAHHSRELNEADAVVDAVLGTGLKSEVRDHLARVIEAVNRSPAPVLAVDIPSGLDADNGRALGAAVEAERTVTFGFAKAGLVTYPGFERAGELRVADIGIPAALAARQAVRLGLLDEAEARSMMPRRPRGGHKGTFGHLLVVAGSAGKTGAALLSAQGGLRAGAGLVTLATAPDARAAVEGRVPEVMVSQLDLERPREQALAEIVGLAAGKRAIAWGPGMPTSDAAGETLRAALALLEVPIVLDADALNHLARDLSVLEHVRAPLVLTPHPGEAARMLGLTTTEVQSDRVATARDLAARARAVVVLKGARTVIAAPDGWAAINPTGNPGMGTGGSGDVLTGIIGALLAQGLDPYAAACLGTYAHGRAGDLARKRRGEMGLVAGDLIDALPEALAALGG